MTIGYACEKMGQVVGTLATGLNELQVRLGQAYSPRFMDATHDAKLEGYLPPNLLARMEVVGARLTSRKPDSEGQGTIDATLSVMSNDDAVEIGDEMLQIAYAIWREGIKAGAYWWWSEDDE